MQSVRLKVINEVGLHARPAALFVSGAQKYKSQVRVRNLTAMTDWVDAKSQEEATYLGLPCLTLRPNTERPITITEGTNELVDMGNIEEHSARILAGQWKQGRVPHLWDGRTAERIARVVLNYTNRES